MTRFVNPNPQYFDDEGNPLDGGKLFYYESGTSNFQTTYSDSSLNNKNTNPVILDEGRLPNDVFLDGVYRIVLQDKDGLVIFDLDPVGGDAGSRLAFADWVSTTIYNAGAIVEGSNGKYYRSIINSNLGNDPVSSPAQWEQIRFLSVWNEFVEYNAGDVVQLENGETYRSLINANLANNPETDPNTWALGTNDKSVIVKSGGGALIALRDNQLTDGSTYTLPRANTIRVGQTIVISLPDRYSDFTPTVQTSGNDTITDDSGNDSEIIFDTKRSISITLTSDGVDNWSL